VTKEDCEEGRQQDKQHAGFKQEVVIIIQRDIVCLIMNDEYKTSDSCRLYVVKITTFFLWVKVALHYISTKAPVALLLLCSFVVTSHEHGM